MSLLNKSDNNQPDELYSCNINMPYCDWNSLDSRFENDEVKFDMKFEDENHELTCDITFPSMYQDFLGPEVGINWEDLVDWDAYLSDRSFHIFNFLKKSKIGRQGVGLKKLNVDKYLKSADSSQPKPIMPGIFKGNYGGHGIEIIGINYATDKATLFNNYLPTENYLVGTKLTGDPNVPMNKMTFKADLKNTIVLSKEEQRQYSCEHFDVDSVDSEFLKKPKGSQPFILPPDVTLEDNIDLDYKTCSLRFLGEVQIALPYFEDSERVPAHIIIFDSDTIGVLKLQLQSISIYKRITEDLGAIVDNAGLSQAEGLGGFSLPSFWLNS
jgi:hypothetical protein